MDYMTLKEASEKWGCYPKADQLSVYRWAYPRRCKDGYHLDDSQGCRETGRPPFQNTKNNPLVRFL